MGPCSFHHVCRHRQEARPQRRARRCLLKGCEHWFTPACPQAHYCSKECSRAATRWRRVKASRSYRASKDGRVQCRERNRCYRQRRRAREIAAAEGAAAREGKRIAPANKNFTNWMCDRPGCYATFHVRHKEGSRHYCSAMCRLALRRVLDRDARRGQRRRRGRKAQVARRIDRPDTS